MKRISHGLALALLTLSACQTDPLVKDLDLDTGSSETGETAVAAIDADGDGFTADEDCDDTNAAIHPDATEICDGIDNDCDTLVDDDDDSLDTSTQTTWYRDADADGFGNESDAVQACDAPTWYVEENASGFDCDDTDPAYHPGASESDCTDPNDYNCDGSVAYADADKDGWAACLECNDADAAIHPDASEICDAIDNDCDGDIDDADASLYSSTATDWYADTDSDGFGDPDNSVRLCEMPSGFVADNTDCDDADANVNPGEAERCNWADDNCDGVADEGLPDVDSSGIADCKEVAIVLTVGAQGGGSGGPCDGLSYMDREIQEVDAFLADLNLSSVLFYDDVSTGVAWSDLSPYPVVIYHNVGWSSAGSLAVQDALGSAASAGTGLLFLGDDLGKHARNMATAHGTNAFYDLAYISNYTDRVYNTTVSTNTTNHDVIDGDYGLVGSYSYVADLDTVSAAGLGETVLMSTADGTPAVLAALDSAGQRTVSVVGSIYNSHDCPISDSNGLGELEVLFKNSLHWLQNW